MIENEQEILLSSLQEEVQQLSTILQKIRKTVSEEEKISNYPIFIAHREANLQLGLVLFDKKTAGCIWDYHITTLEELVKKQILDLEKVDEFRVLYKSKMQTALCVFVLHQKLSQWVFVPVG